MLGRRRLLAAGARLAAAGLLAGCTSPEGAEPTRGEPRRAGALGSRPQASPSESLPEPGTHPLGLVPVRDALLHVPPGLQPGRPAPLVVTLHGAGGDAQGGLSLLQSLADERGLVLLAPASRGPTWDAVRGGYGQDVDVLDRALEQVFRTVPVDPRRVGVAGFSDGASYALGLGLANGGLFRRVVAFSPGFVPPGSRPTAPSSTAPARRPAVFVSHGDDDDVLPVRLTSRRIVPGLRRNGYRVTYREFDGPHVVPPEIAQAAVDWLGWG